MKLGSDSMVCQDHGSYVVMRQSERSSLHPQSRAGATASQFHFHVYFPLYSYMSPRVGLWVLLPWALFLKWWLKKSEWLWRPHDTSMSWRFILFIGIVFVSVKQDVVMVLRHAELRAWNTRKSSVKTAHIGSEGQFCVVSSYLLSLSSFLATSWLGSDLSPPREHFNLPFWASVSGCFLLSVSLIQMASWSFHLPLLESYTKVVVGSRTFLKNAK
jgi:hypothetical protein